MVKDWQFHIATDIQWSRIAISHCYWHLVVRNKNFTLLLTSSGQDGHFAIATDIYYCQEYQFHIATDIQWSSIAISHYYWHLVKNGNFTLLILWSTISHCYWHLVTRMSNFTLLLTFHISHCYWHLVVRNINFTLLLTSSGQVLQFHIGLSWHLVVKNCNFTLLLTSSDQAISISHCYWHLVINNCNFTLLLTSSGQELQFHIATDI